MNSEQSTTKAAPLLEGMDPEKAALTGLDDDRYDDKGRLTTWPERLCLGLTVTIMVGLVIGIICVGVIPARDFKNSEPVVLASTATRIYYLVAEEVEWTYTPGGKDTIWAPLEGTYVNHTTDPSFIEGVFIKGQFVEYTDDTFTVKKNISDRWKHLGLLGPVLRAEPGDTIEVWLRNLINAPVNVEPLGVAWNIEGNLGPIAPGLTGMFKILVPTDAGPQPESEQSSHMFLYRSAVNPTRHENSGLVGPIIITRKGEANPDGTPIGVDREIITLYQIYNEIETEFAIHNGPYWTANNWSTDRYAINGRSFGTLEGLEMNVGEKVRWYISGLGTENAMHNFHWHGNVLTTDGHNVDQLTVLPATTLVADMYPDNPGPWLFHCHVNSHLTGGMANTYTVRGPMPPPTTGGVVREYFIAAEEVQWNYAPLGGMACTQDGSVEPFNDEANVYLGPAQDMRLGSVLTKAMFVEYTDANFNVRKNRSLGAEEDYLGIQGPLIRARVGDTIRIRLRNNLPAGPRGFPVSLHPHGVLYNKSSEGAPYEDGTSGYDHADDAVLPGAEHTYIWEVPERAGPGPNDASSIMWMYHSHADETRDTWAGLVGAMLFTARDTPVRENGSPLDVDVERVLFFAAMDEAQSLYTDINIREKLNITDEAAITETLANEGFLASAVHRSINGYMFCNMPRLTLPAGARSRLHFMALGDIGDMHTPRMGPGGGFIDLGQRRDAVQMSAGGMHSVDVVLSERGTWQLGCNVLEHEMGGIAAMYTVSNYTRARPDTSGATIREFFIQAEDVLWDYAPNGYQKCTIVDFTIRGAPYLVRTNATIGSGMYRKALYREFTNAEFTVRKEQPVYQGIMGPLMVVEVGDVLKVTLKNTLSIDINLSPGGGLISLKDDPQAGQVVRPGETFVYEWYVPQEAGPMPGGLSSVAYAYSSTVSHLVHSLLGLEGMLVVAPTGRLKTAVRAPGQQLGASLMPDDVDYLVPLLWQVFDQNFSPYTDEDLERAGLVVANIDKANPDFIESQIKHGINGWMYCNLPPPEFHLHSRVRLVFMSVGSTEGLHSPVITKFPLIDADGAHDSATLMPGYTSTMDLIANYTGLFPMWCNVHDHLEAGMSGQYSIVNRS